MLWNWNTIDACFLSSTWHIRSNGMFAGACIGVILLVISPEFLRRSVKEYDRFLLRKYAERQSQAQSAGSGSQPECPPVERETATTPTAPWIATGTSSGYRPTIVEQAVRSLLHTVQFAVAYFIMLYIDVTLWPVMTLTSDLLRLAMYYNGYIIICIFIGAYLGAFVFQWERLGAWVFS